MPRSLAAETGRSKGLPADGNFLTRKLSHFVPMSASDRQVLDALTFREERFVADVDIVTEGSSPRSAFLLKEGMAVRYRMMPDGGRQIMTFLIPGDLCDEHIFLVKEMDHSIGTITPVRIALISQESMIDIFAHSPRISTALWWSGLQEQAMLRERIVALGRRDARGRIAYLLCELLWRYAVVGLTDRAGFQLSLTQTELGDALGLTPVSVNRVLKEFRHLGLIDMHQKVINLLQISALQETAGLRKDYLLQGEMSPKLGRYFDAMERKSKPRDRSHTVGPRRGTQ
jgi:CRP-like cAMP-binding protein